jgi:hypothetical protein
MQWLRTNQMSRVIYFVRPSKAQNSNSSIDITPFMDWKQNCTTLHAILVDKRMSLPSFSQSISVRFLEVCEITFFLKTFLRIMITRAEIDFTRRFRLRHLL